MLQITHRVSTLLNLPLLAFWSIALTSSSLAQTVLPLAQQPVLSPQAYAVCQPPTPGEYLLLVVSRTPESQERLRRTLPPAAGVTTCNYLNDVVTRVSGFTTIETANAWAKYLTDTLSLPAYVVRPAELPPTPIPVPVPLATPSSPTRTPPTFNPQPLGAGYAVLVDYFNRPELAVQVRQLVQRDVGLVAYGQRPYLLAIHTTNSTLANSTLQTLTERGLTAIVVDSRQVTLLRRPIDLSRLTAQP